MANRSEPYGVNISSLDANPDPSASRGRGAPSPSQTSTGPTKTTFDIAIPAGTYADDDSVVSSNVTYDEETPSSSDGSNGNGSDPEVAILTRSAAADVENARANANAKNINGNDNVEVQERKKGILPRNRREWCIVLLAILLILAVALGTGLGLGMALGGENDSSKTNTNTAKDLSGTGSGQPDQPGSDGTGNGQDGNSQEAYTTLSPTQTPNNSTNGTSNPQEDLSADKLSPYPPVDPNDLSSAVTWHAINQEISALTSFPDLTIGDNETASDRQSAQQKARDFLVLRDYLPMAIDDEDDEQSTSNGGDDDPLAIPEKPKRRPYLETSTPAYRVAQRFAATVLYYASKGDEWETNQLWVEPGVHECDFVGVTCEELPIPAITLKETLELDDSEEIPRHDDGSVDITTERMIVAIDLPENKMGGYLPQEIMALPYLQRLGLWSNSIRGQLPTQLGLLTRLSVLHMDDNLFDGKIPTEIGLLTEMTDLSLDLNEFIEGSIPEEIGSLSKLERLRLSDMALSGPIPSSFGNLVNLVDLYLQNNNLKGSLPRELKNLVNLESLLLNDNEFTGGIPLSWRNLRNLERLEIQSNRLEFNLDDRICKLRDDAPEEGLLATLVADCAGDEPKVSCTCCTACLS